jgi:hypothetical protein
MDALAWLEPVHCELAPRLEFATAPDPFAPRPLGASRVVLLRVRGSRRGNSSVILKRALVGAPAHTGVPGGAPALQGGLEVARGVDAAGLAWLCRGTDLKRRLGAANVTAWGMCWALNG